jgi:alpha-L-fucosidase
MRISRRKAVQLLAASAGAMCAASVLGQTAGPGATNPPAGGAAAGDAAPGGAAGASPVSGNGATTAPSIVLPPAPAQIAVPAGFGIADGPFQPTFESLSNWKVPDWYRDAKFGIWAHWGPQCQPEQGDWYAQNMYLPAQAVYKWHLEHYGHPSKFGFKDVINTWKAEAWEPAELIALYKKAGAKFFSSMAHHHDNFDNFDSTYQPWNSVNIGPKKDIVGGWRKAAREAGLKFGISSHGDRAWSWYQAAQSWDATGPLAGVPYDGITPKSAGKGLWWEGYDPQDLYAQYHKVGKYNWAQTGDPPIDKLFCEKYFHRIVDLITKYEPDLLYFDDTVMPIYPTSDVGPRIAAYLYNTNLARHGSLQAVMTGKDLTNANAKWRQAILLDVERGVSGGADAIPWQTDTCIGSWHYKRAHFDQHDYKTAFQVVQMLVDIVSKNGNLMLNIPVRGNGTIDEDEVEVLEGIADWMAANGEGIFGTRPAKVYGEGPSTVTAPARGRGGRPADFATFKPNDVRFTIKGDLPADGKAVIKSLVKRAEIFPRDVAKVELLGAGPLMFTQDENGLTISLPDKKPNDIAYGFKITPA